MIKRSTFAFGVIASSFVVGAVFAAPGCSSSSSSGGTTAPDTGTTAPPYTRVVPPVRPTGTAGTGTTKWFAMNSLALGTNRKGTQTQDANAWKDYGFDLDDRNTTSDDSKSNNNSCHKLPNAPATILADGNGGIDNNFGGHVMSLIRQLRSTAESDVNAAITNGSFTLLLRIDNVTTADNPSAPGKIYVASDFGGDPTAPVTPTFTEADHWPVNITSLTDGTTIDNAKLTFPNGYISNGYWVSGDFGSGTIDLNLSLSGASIELPIDAGIISVKLGDGSDGTIAGALSTDKLQTALEPVAKRFGICPGNTTYDQVVSTLTQSADLVTGSPNPPNLQDTTANCNSISIALGFTITPTGEPTTTIDTSGNPGTDQCSTGDAGTDAASSD